MRGRTTGEDVRRDVVARLASFASLYSHNLLSMHDADFHRAGGSMQLRSVQGRMSRSLLPCRPFQQTRQPFFHVRDRPHGGAASRLVPQRPPQNLS